MCGRESTAAAISKSGELTRTCLAPIHTCNNRSGRETMKRLLNFPPDTNIVWKSHDDSIAQRTAIDQARQDKAAGNTGHHQAADRRRGVNVDDSAGDKGKASAS